MLRFRGLEKIFRFFTNPFGSLVNKKLSTYLKLKLLKVI